MSLLKIYSFLLGWLVYLLVDSYIWLLKNFPTVSEKWGVKILALAVISLSPYTPLFFVSLLIVDDCTLGLLSQTWFWSSGSQGCLMPAAWAPLGLFQKWNQWPTDPDLLNGNWRKTQHVFLSALQLALIPGNLWELCSEVTYSNSVSQSGKCVCSELRCVSNTSDAKTQWECYIPHR